MIQYTPIVAKNEQNCYFPMIIWQHSRALRLTLNLAEMIQEAVEEVGSRVEGTGEGQRDTIIALAIDL